MKSKIKILIAVLAVCAAAFGGVWLFTSEGMGIDNSGHIVFTQKAESAELTLVNDDNHVPDNWDVELTTLSNGEQVEA